MFDLLLRYMPHILIQIAYNRGKPEVKMNLGFLG
jgi:hypothetical protein